MKCERENRVLHLSEIPQQNPGDLTELDIYVNYVDKFNDMNRGSKAVLLDGQILPHIERLLNIDLEVFRNAERYAKQLDGLIDGVEEDDLGQVLVPIRDLLRKLV